MRRFSTKSNVGLSVLIIIAVLVLGGSAGAALKDCLVAYYPFDDGTGADESGYGNDGVMVGGSVLPEAGLVGGCMNFSGSGTIEAPDAPQIDLVSSLTMQVWVKATGERMALFGKAYAWPEDIFPYYVELFGDGRINVLVDGWEDDNFFGADLNDDQWHHIVVIFDDENDLVHAYIDGVYEGDGGEDDARIQDEKNDFPLVIGALPWGKDSSAPSYQRFFIGLMDEVALWDRILSPEEVNMLYNGGQGLGINSAVFPVNPPNGDDTVNITESLEWVTNIETPGVTYDLYFAASDPNLLTTPVLEGTTETSYSPTLDYETTYFWKVDAYEPNDIGITLHEGLMWSFTTRGAVPFIDVQPVDIVVAVADTGVFNITATSATPETYAWYKVGDDTVLSTTDTLTIFNVQISDQDEYYCEVTNSTGTTTSDIVYLTAKQLIARWEFEDDLTDETTNGWDGTISSGEPNYVAGISNKAVEFFDDGRYIDIAGSSVGFDFVKRGYTMSCWVKTTQIGWGSILTKSTRDGDDDYDEYSGIQLVHYDGWTVHQIPGYNDAWGQGSVNDDNWHLIVGTYDAQANQSCVYVDGVFQDVVGNIASVNPTSDIRTNQNFIIGNEVTIDALTGSMIGSSVPYGGQVDDARICNYALTPTEVGYLYTEVYGSFCPVHPQFDSSGPEGEPDCIVDFYDFADFAAGWLECLTFPTCISEL